MLSDPTHCFRLVYAYLASFFSEDEYECRKTLWYNQCRYILSCDIGGNCWLTCMNNTMRHVFCDVHHQQNNNLNK